jgi:hypothetical protein
VQSLLPALFWQPPAEGMRMKSGLTPFLQLQVLFIEARSVLPVSKEAGGRGSLGPADVVGTTRLIPSPSDDAPSPSQANN